MPVYFEVQFFLLFFINICELLLKEVCLVNTCAKSSSKILPSCLMPKRQYLNNCSRHQKDLLYSLFSLTQHLSRSLTLNGVLYLFQNFYSLTSLVQKRYLPILIIDVYILWDLLLNWFREVGTHITEFTYRQIVFILLPK